MVGIRFAVRGSLARYRAEPTGETPGLPDGWMPVNTVSGGFTINSSQVIEDWQINGGSLAVNSGAVVTLRRCKIVGAVGDFYGIENNNGTLVLDHCEFSGSLSAAAFRGYNITATWCELTGLPSDGIKIENNNTITDCLLHNFVPATGAHLDGVQMETDSGNILIARNTIIVPGVGDSGIDDTTGCLFMIPQLVSSYGPRAVGDIIVENNVFSGGADGVHLSDGVISGTATPLTGVHFRNNTFVDGTFLFDAVYPSGYEADEWTGNAFQTSGAVVPPPGGSSGGTASWSDTFTDPSLNSEWVDTSPLGSVVYPAPGGSSVQLVSTDSGSTIWTSGATATRLGRALAGNPLQFDLYAVLIDNPAEAGIFVRGTSITSDFVKLGVFTGGLTFAWASGGSPAFSNGGSPGTAPTAIRLNRNGDSWTAFYSDSVPTPDNLSGITWVQHGSVSTASFTAVELGLYAGGGDSPRFAYAELVVP